MYLKYNNYISQKDFKFFLINFIKKKKYFLNNFLSIINIIP
jgi:hypothetical protein